MLLTDRQTYPNQSPRVFALALQRLNVDWQQLWSQPILLVESFVDETNNREQECPSSHFFTRQTPFLEQHGVPGGKERGILCLPPSGFLDDVTAMASRIFLSPPHLGGTELAYVEEAFATNWVAPAGPHLNAFETEFAQLLGVPFAAAVVSGTAALHLALIVCGVQPGDTVVCSDLTFVGSVNPIRYVGAEPVFVDSDETSWNMDPNLFEEAVRASIARGQRPKAAIIVHLYGQATDLAPIQQICDEHGITLIEDAAEALGTSYRGRPAGTFGRLSIFSFNGNKIITTSGGGMLVGADESLIREARFLATQARDPAPHYQHTSIGYNYRLSNILAGLGRGQLRYLNERVEARRAVFNFYRDRLGHWPGISFMPEPGWGRATRWLTCLTIDPQAAGVDRETVRLHLEKANIESRPVWKPMHLQPLYASNRCFGGAVGERLFRDGLCLPSGSALSRSDLERIVETMAEVFPGAVLHSEGPGSESVPPELVRTMQTHSP